MTSDAVRFPPEEREPSIAAKLADLRRKDPEEYEKILSGFTDEQLAELQGDWLFWARPEQIPPEEPWRTWFARGGRACIRGDSRVYLPDSGRWVPVASITESVRVLSLTAAGPEPHWTDGAPYLKGRAPLSTFILEDGRRITVAKGHRFLTDQGWTEARNVQVGHLVGASENVPTTHVGDGPRSMQTTGGSGAGCRRGCRCDDGRPQSGAETVPDELLSLAGVRGLGSDGCDAGDREHAEERIQSCRSSDHLPRKGSAPLGNSLVGGESHDEPCSGAQLLLRRPGVYLSRESSDLVRPTGRSARDEVTGRVADALTEPLASQRSSDTPGLQRHNLRARDRLSGVIRRIVGREPSTRLLGGTKPLLPECPHGLVPYRYLRVVAILPAGSDVFYDLTVPGSANYLAEGIWHHNSGKTRAASEAMAALIKEHWEDGDDGHWGVIGPTFADARDVMIEGPSGLLKPLEGSYDQWTRTYGQLHLSNGQVVYCDGAYEGAPRVQGKNLKGAWLDEVGLFRLATGPKGRRWWWIAYNESINLAVRIKPAKKIISGTPKRGHPLVKQFLNDPNVVNVRLRMVDNIDNLSEEAVQEFVLQYKGTSLEASELEGEFGEVPEGALWTPEVVSDSRWQESWDEPVLRRVGVGVDPSGGSSEGSGETGIIGGGIVAGKCPCGRHPDQPHIVVMGDYSLRATPDVRAKAIAAAYHDLEADVVFGERNYGGDWVEAFLRQLDERIPYKEVNATRGKAVRAEPIAMAAEQGRIHHRRVFERLEEQLYTWTPESGWSPDRLDAYVWLCTGLLDRPMGQATVRVAQGRISDYVG